MEYITFWYNKFSFQKFTNLLQIKIKSVGISSSVAAIYIQQCQKCFPQYYNFIMFIQQVCFKHWSTLLQAVNLRNYVHFRSTFHA